MDYIYSSTNGSAQLPALPTWDKATYPVGVIVHCYGADAQAFYGAEYFFAVGTSAGQSGRFVLRGCGGIWVPGDGVWTYKSGYVGQTVQLSYDGWQLPIWTNKDIYYADGTLYLAATVPVEPGGEPVEPDVPDAPGINVAQLRRAYINGLITGLNLRGNLRKKATLPIEAAHYLYGTPSESGNVAIAEGDGYRLYDGGLLPEWDKEKYPYVFVLLGFLQYTVEFWPAKPVVETGRSSGIDTYGAATEITNVLSYTKNLGDTDWGTARNQTKNPDNRNTVAPFWGNADLYTVDGDLYLAGVDPIPLASNEPVAAVYGEEKLPYIDTVYTDELQETHRYAFIGTEDGQTEPWFYASESELKFDQSGLRNPTGGGLRIFKVENGEWKAFMTLGMPSNGRYAAVPIWSNFNILNYSDGSTYLAASDPIPIYEQKE